MDWTQFRNIVEGLSLQSPKKAITPAFRLSDFRTLTETFLEACDVKDFAESSSFCEVLTSSYEINPWGNVVTIPLRLSSTGPTTSSRAIESYYSIVIRKCRILLSEISPPQSNAIEKLVKLEESLEFHICRVNAILQSLFE